jgi:hypothetical protein
MRLFDDPFQLRWTASQGIAKIVAEASSPDGLFTRETDTPPTHGKLTVMGVPRCLNELVR